MVGAFGGCGPSAGTCSADGHSVLSPGRKQHAANRRRQSGVRGRRRVRRLRHVRPDAVLAGERLHQGLRPEGRRHRRSKEATTCPPQVQRAADCPFNYSCIASDSGQGYCAEDRTPPTIRRRLAVGDPCDPTKGFDQNADSTAPTTSGATARRPPTRTRSARNTSARTTPTAPAAGGAVRSTTRPTSRRRSATTGARRRRCAPRATARSQARTARRAMTATARRRAAAPA